MTVTPRPRSSRARAPRRRTDVEQHRVAVVDEPGGPTGDGLLLGRRVVGHLVVGPVDLDLRRHQGGRPTVNPLHDAGVRQLGEVATDGGRRHPEAVDQGGDRYGTAPDLVDNRPMSGITHATTMAR